MEVFGFGEETAFAESGIDEAQVVGGDADEQGVQHVLALVAGGDRGQSEFAHFAEEFHGDRGGRGHLFFDCHGVLVAERLAEALFAGHLVRRAHLQLVNPQRARAELFRHIDELIVETGDDGGHGDHGGGADQHAEDGEEGAELMGAERIERQEQVLADVVGRLAMAINSPIAALRWDRGARPSAG